MGEPPGAGAERGRPNNGAPAGYRVCNFGLRLGGLIPERETSLVRCGSGLRRSFGGIDAVHGNASILEA